MIERQTEEDPSLPWNQLGILGKAGVGVVILGAGLFYVGALLAHHLVRDPETERLSYRPDAFWLMGIGLALSLVGREIGRRAKHRAKRRDTQE